MTKGFDRDAAAIHLDRAGRILAIAAALLAVFLLLLRLLIHFPIIDEVNNAHYLWLISEGLKPGPDFFCTYPVLFYLFISPVFRWFPETAYILLALRLLSILLYAIVGLLLFRHGRRSTGDWVAAAAAPILIAASTSIGPFLVEFSIDHAAAALAVAAMTLMFRQATNLNTAAVAALCLLSVSVTPKYAFGLFFGLLGYIAADCLQSRNVSRTLGAVALGGVAAGASVLGFYLAYGISLPTNIRTAFVLTAKLAMNREDLSLRLGGTVLWGLFLNPLFGLIVLMGIAGWVKRSLHRADGIALAGAGILLGTVLFCVRTSAWFEQYQTVAYLSLALFAPFAFTWLREAFHASVIRCVFAALTLVIAAHHVPAAAREFAGTNVGIRESAFLVTEVGPPAAASLSFTDFLLKTIPPEERVVAVWIHHPIFRRDLTPIVTDDRPSLSSFMADDDPTRRLFEPEFFREELQHHPPAMIDLNQTGVNYPPGWAEVAQDFLRENETLYTPVQSLIIPQIGFFLRKDLFPSDPN